MALSANNFFDVNEPFGIDIPYVLPTNYNSTNLPFESGKKISTLESRSRAAITCCAVIALSAVAAVALTLTTGSIVWCWPAVLVGSTYLVWTAYSQLLRKDPLVEAFYKIVGGKKEFDKLPEFKLAGRKIDILADQIDWNQLSHPIYRAKTWDGRKIMIVKGFSLQKEHSSILAELSNPSHPSHMYVSHGCGEKKPIFDYPKIVFAFVEKILNSEYGWGESYDKSGSGSIRRCYTLSHISSDLANHFAIQWKDRSDSLL